MSSIKNLKKDVNYVLGDIIDAVANANADAKASEGIVNEVIDAFDGFIERINAKNVENKKEHFNTIQKDLETTASALIEKVNKL